MTDPEKIRVWVDGCFDLFHFGHANALRQAKDLGNELIVGIHSDKEIRINKGPPVFGEEERYKMLRSIKWVDETVENVPYNIDTNLLDKYNCDFCTHGDDLVINSTGMDSYEKVKAANRFRQFKRTPGISTTDLISRILKIDHPLVAATDGSARDIAEMDYSPMNCDFLATTLRISQFHFDLKEPTDEDIVIYAPGCFDLFHVGHCLFLEECKKLGTYVIVGLYSDQTAKSIYGAQFPVMTLYERLLSVLSCKYVSNVVLTPPYKVTETMMEELKIDLVVHGSTGTEKLEEIFEVPKGVQKFRTIVSGSDLTLEIVIERIKKNSAEYELRNSYKKKNESIGNELKKEHI